MSNGFQSNPDVAELGRFGSLPVGKYTGTVNVSVPIYAIDFAGMQIPISLSYNSSGVRVAQEATWVGLGWNLSANAVISRKINGFDDLLNSAAQGNQRSVGYIYSQSVQPPAAGFTNSKLSASDSVFVGLEWTRGLVLDLEPDLFTVNLFGASYSFTLSKIIGNNDVVHGINHDNADLIVRYFVTDKRFEIVDANGFTYFFNSKELSDPFRVQGTPYYGTQEISSEVTARDQVGVVALDRSKTRDAIMSIHLDSITSPFDRVIKFEYEDGLYFSYPNYTHSYSLNPNGLMDHEVYGYHKLSGAPNINVDCNITVMKTKYLRKIYGDFGEVDFQLGDRLDLYSWTAHSEATGRSGVLNPLPNNIPQNQRRLDRVIVKNKRGEVLKTADLSYSYFNGDVLNDSQEEHERYIRLKLDNVSIDDQQYSFEYEQPNSLPAKDSPSEDFWGFYNGQANTHSNKAMRIPTFGRYVRASRGNGTGFRSKYIIFEGATRGSDFDYGKIGILKRITYPTGGHSEFEYEGNTASVARPFSTNRATLYNSSTEYKYNYQYLERAELQKVGGAALQAGVPFTITGSQTVPGDNVFITAQGRCENTGLGGAGACVFNGEEIIITNVNNPSITYGLNISIPTTRGTSNSPQDVSIALPNGTYTFRTASGISSVGATVSILEANLVDIPPPATGDVFRQYEVGGARLKSITDKDVDGQFISKREYDYNENITSTTFRSSGTLMDELVFHSKNGYFDYTPEGYNGTSINLSSSSLLSGPGSHVSYTQVTEKETDQAGNFKGSKKCIYYNQANSHYLRTIGSVPEFGWYNYNNNLGGNRIVHYGNVYYLGISPNANDHLNGKMYREILYNSAGEMVKRTSYSYTTQEVETIGAWKVYYSGSTLAPVSHSLGYNLLGKIALLEQVTVEDQFKENTASPVTLQTSTNNEYGSKDKNGLQRHFWPTRVVTINSEQETPGHRNQIPTR